MADGSPQTFNSWDQVSSQYGSPVSDQLQALNVPLSQVGQLAQQYGGFSNIAYGAGFGFGGFGPGQQQQQQQQGPPPGTIQLSGAQDPAYASNLLGAQALQAVGLNPSKSMTVNQTPGTGQASSNFAQSGVSTVSGPMNYDISGQKTPTINPQIGSVFNAVQPLKPTISGPMTEQPANTNPNWGNMSTAQQNAYMRGQDMKYGARQAYSQEQNQIQQNQQAGLYINPAAQPTGAQTSTGVPFATPPAIHTMQTPQVSAQLPATPATLPQPPAAPGNAIAGSPFGPISSLSPSATPPGAPGLASGYGTAIKHMAGGGSVGDTDTVPAMLTPGEYVINQQAAQKLGRDKLDQLNGQHFRRGGAVRQEGPEPMQPRGTMPGPGPGGVAPPGGASQIPQYVPTTAAQSASNPLLGWTPGQGGPSPLPFRFPGQAQSGPDPLSFRGGSMPGPGPGGVPPPGGAALPAPQVALATGASPNPLMGWTPGQGGLSPLPFDQRQRFQEGGPVSGLGYSLGADAQNTNAQSSDAQSYAFNQLAPQEQVALQGGGTAGQRVQQKYNQLVNSYQGSTGTPTPMSAQMGGTSSPAATVAQVHPTAPAAPAGQPQQQRQPGYSGSLDQWLAQYGHTPQGQAYIGQNGNVNEVQRYLQNLTTPQTGTPAYTDNAPRASLVSAPAGYGAAPRAQLVGLPAGQGEAYDPKTYGINTGASSVAGNIAGAVGQLGSSVAQAFTKGAGSQPYRPIQSAIPSPSDFKSRTPDIVLQGHQVNRPNTQGGYVLMAQPQDQAEEGYNTGYLS